MVRSPKRPHPALLVMLLLLAIVAFCFYRGQNLAGHVGGAISIPKIFWLNYAICVFMVVPGFMWRDQRLDPALRFIFGCQFGNWLVRGAVELVLMYGLHAWIPPYGIYHGIFTLVMLMTLRYRYRSVLATASTHVDQNAKRFLFFSMLTSMCEIYFAWHFYMAANFDTRTTWFASGTPAYIYINRVTTVVDFLAYTGLFMTVLRFYRPGALRLRQSQLSP
ncbi:MAG: hypothetical protein H7338_14440 [Candidatus Sericytochromatia bacterium]|nr:hypothetical protein [Candidatus Sericytochromatia bacterium]